MQRQRVYKMPKHGPQTDPNGIPNGDAIADAIQNGIPNGDAIADAIPNGISNGDTIADASPNGIPNAYFFSAVRFSDFYHPSCTIAMFLLSQGAPTSL